MTRLLKIILITTSLFLLDSCKDSDPSDSVNQTSSLTKATANKIIIVPIDAQYKTSDGYYLTLFGAKNTANQSIYYLRTVRAKLYNPTSRLNFKNEAVFMSTQCGYFEKHEWIELKPNAMDTLKTSETFFKTGEDSTILGFSFYEDTSFTHKTEVYLTLRNTSIQ